jgi:hypothetical protein
MVLRANPVTFETAARPPHPAARTSLAANNRRPRSSRFEPSASHRCRIASVSIMPTLVSVSSPYRDYPQLSHTVAAVSTGSSDSLIVAPVLRMHFAHRPQMGISDVRRKFQPVQGHDGG